MTDTTLLATIKIKTIVESLIDSTAKLQATRHPRMNDAQHFVKCLIGICLFMNLKLILVIE